MLASEIVRVDSGPMAVEHIDLRPGTAVETEPGPCALPESRAAELCCVELRIAEGAADERAAGDADALEIAGVEGAAGELATGPACLLEGGRGEAAAGEGAGGELGEVQVEAGIGGAVALPGKAGWRTARAFSPAVVIQDDDLRRHARLSTTTQASWPLHKPTCLRASCTGSRHSIFSCLIIHPTSGFNLPKNSEKESDTTSVFSK